MSEQEQLKSTFLVADDVADGAELPYRIDLWSADKNAIERVLGRVASVTLAQAIFKAAQDEHPMRYITLRHGSQLIAESE